MNIDGDARHSVTNVLNEYTPLATARRWCTLWSVYLRPRSTTSLETLQRLTLFAHPLHNDSVPEFSRGYRLPPIAVEGASFEGEGP